MKFLLVLYVLIGGEIESREIAVFRSQGDCEIVGTLTASFLSSENTRGAVVKHECKAVR